MYVRICSLVLVMLVLSGCGTVIGRAAGSTPYGLLSEDYYLATQADTLLLTGGLGTGYDYTTIICWLSIVCPVAVIYSLPVDIAVDTLLLPYDMYRR